MIPSRPLQLKDIINLFRSFCPLYFIMHIFSFFLSVQFKVLKYALKTEDIIHAAIIFLTNDITCLYQLHFFSFQNISYYTTSYPFLIFKIDQFFFSNIYFLTCAQKSTSVFHLYPSMSSFHSAFRTYKSSLDSNPPNYQLINTIFISVPDSSKVPQNLKVTI